MLRIFLFGAPRIEQNGQAVALRRSKALALLAYLALTRRPQDREALLALLWPEFDAASARNNLRRELSLLRSSLGEELLLADRFQVAWNAQASAWLDVAAFREQLAIPLQHQHPASQLCAECAAALATAVQLSTDDFLAGFSLPESPAFDEWQFFQREALRQQLADTLQALIGWQSRQGQHSAAIEHARRWLALDGLHEPAQRALMRLYALAGQHSAALRQYEECARLLDQELGAKPEAETLELYEAIKARRLASPGRQETGEPGAQEKQDARQGDASLGLAQHNLPQTTGFVGRQRELADIIRRLTDPSCRLLTLTGPGGIGKTRLALHVAATLADGWAGEAAISDGMLYVPLTAVDTPSGLVSALAAAAQFDFYPNASPQQQVCDYFRDKRMLVVLDNFEQLLDAVGFVGELLAAAPHLRLLATSRVALNLREEWFHPIEGLSFPTEAGAITGVTQLARFDAVRLFEHHARRARGDFLLGRERAQVVRLCQLVAGMPLAIELAASWLKVLSVDQVVAALERGLDILTTRDRNIPERHRSMRAVLEESWRLLPGEGQRALAALSVFSGGFSAEAAAAVAGATLDMLAMLVEKSLLWAGAEGRFQLHELLRQFAAEQLAVDASLAHTISMRHSVYYLGFLADREASLLGAGQLVAADQLMCEADNMWAAWRWANAHEQLESVDRVLYSVYLYHFTRGSFLEGVEILSAAVVEASRATDTSLRSRVGARARILRSVFRTYLDDDDPALHDIESALATVQVLGLQRDIATAHHVRGLVLLHRGNTEGAREQFHAALTLGRASDDKHLVADVLQELVRVCWWQHDFAEGKRLALECMDVSRAAGRVDWMAQALLRLSDISIPRGEYHEAERYAQESLALFERVDNQYGIAKALGHLGYVRWRLGDSVEAACTYYQRSLSIFRTLGMRVRISDRLADMAQMAIDVGDYAQAQAYSQEGLALARALDNPIFVSYHCSLLGAVASARQDAAASSQYLREALGIAAKANWPPMLAFTLYNVAASLAYEATALGAAHPAYAPQLARALELLAVITHHPAITHSDQVRASRLIDQLRRDLAPDLSEAAIARGQLLEWPALIEPLLEELGRPLRGLQLSA
jgi:predicted ATPase/DNA-binding SARP family transcriptional activator